MSASAKDVINLSASYVVPIPEFALDCRFGANEDFESDRIELELLSPVIPVMRVAFDVVTRSTHVMAQSDMEDDGALIENNLSNYTAIRMPFKVKEGTRRAADPGVQERRTEPVSGALDCVQARTGSAWI